MRILTLGISLLALMYAHSASGQAMSGQELTLKERESLKKGVACREPAKEYLKQAESQYREAWSATVYPSMQFRATQSIAASLLYQICSQLEKEAELSEKK